MSCGSVWMTLPNTTCPTSLAPIPARFTDSRTTVAASSVGGWSFRLPPYRPIAVRTALRTTTSRSEFMLVLPSGDAIRPLGPCAHQIARLRPSFQRQDRDDPANTPDIQWWGAG